MIKRLSGTSGRYHVVEVRTVEDLRTCDAVILPGGESTAMRIIGTNGGNIGMIMPCLKA
jgi:glutamine amidotransferase PdxT